MSHGFFNNSYSLEALAAAHCRFKPAMYDLAIKPNTCHQGVPVEANMAGIVVAYTDQAGMEIRNNYKYLFMRHESGAWLCDRSQTLHPID